MTKFKVVKIPDRYMFCLLANDTLLFVMDKSGDILRIKDLLERLEKDRGN